jgi:hypothetical protein
VDRSGEYPVARNTLWTQELQRIACVPLGNERNETYFQPCDRSSRQGTSIPAPNSAIYGRPQSGRIAALTRKSLVQINGYSNEFYQGTGSMCLELK